MDDLPIEQVPAHPDNYAVGRHGQKPSILCYHLMQGTWEGTGAWFATARAEPSSAHFGVSRTGRIAQYVAVANAAYSNGIIHNPQTALIPWIVDCLQQHINPNDLTISIEMEGMQRGQWVTQAGGIQTFAPGSIKDFWTPTEAQYQGVLRLSRGLIAAWTIPVDRAHLCRHSDIDGVKKWWCPGLGFPLGRLLHDLGGL